MKKTLFFGLSLLLSFALFSQSISSSVMSASGTSFESDDFTLHFSIGEPLNTIIEEGDIMLSQGVIQITLNEVFSDVAEVILTDIQVYPNPTTDIVNLFINHQNEQLSYAVLDLNGVILQKAPLTEKSTAVNLKHIAKGIYVLKIFKNQQDYQVFRLLKQ